jgi:predicted dehydrogenase
MADLRGALIGYGLAGSLFQGPMIAATTGLAVSTVVTGNPERRAAAAKAFPDAQVVSDPEEIFERAADYDFVVVAAPNDVHVALARRALDAGLPVVVDKPLAPTAAEARALVEHAEETRIPIIPYMNRRWDSDQLTLRRLLDERSLGQLLRYESRLERWQPLSGRKPWSETSPPEGGGGVLLDLGSHLVDQALVLFGAVSRVYAELESHRGGPADDDAFLALEHDSAARSHLWTSLVTATPGPRLRVLGDRAAYVVTDVDGQEDALRAGARPGEGGGDWGAEPEERWGRLISEQGSEPIPSEPGAWPRFYAGLERALRQGSPPPVDPWDAVAGLGILDAARRSASTGTIVSLR